MAVQIHICRTSNIPNFVTGNCTMIVLHHRHPEALQNAYRWTLRTSYLGWKFCSNSTFMFYLYSNSTDILTQLFLPLQIIASILGNSLGREIQRSLHICINHSYSFSLKLILTGRPVTDGRVYLVPWKHDFSSEQYCTVEYIIVT